MKARRFILLVLLAVALLPSLAQNLCGTWHGALNVGGQKLGLIFISIKTAAASIRENGCAAAGSKRNSC